MRDNILEELSKLVTDLADRNDRINRWLLYIILALIAAFVITVLGIVAIKDGMYFLSDYQYPEQSNISTQEIGDVKQEIKQSIKKGDDK